MLKNYTSEGKNTFEKIQKILVAHKANQLMFDYEENGKIKALSFSLTIDGHTVGFKLPARVDKVEAIFLAEKKKRSRYNYGISLTETDKDQAYKTAWANIRDWLDAQMALIDTEQVKIQEVFLPYAVDRSGRTYFEVIENKGYQLGSGVEEGEVIDVR